MRQLLSWTKEPNRVIHWVVSVASAVALVALDLSNALNGTETWIGAAVAIANLVQGEIARQFTSPATSPTAGPVAVTTMAPIPTGTTEKA